MFLFSMITTFFYVLSLMWKHSRRKAKAVGKMAKSWDKANPTPVDRFKSLRKAEKNKPPARTVAAD